MYLGLLMKTLKTMGKLSWSEIKCHTGLRMKSIETRHELPSGVSPEINLLELRVSRTSRIHGFRVDRVFQVLWFDPRQQPRSA